MTGTRVAYGYSRRCAWWRPPKGDVGVSVWPRVLEETDLRVLSVSI